MVTMVSHENSDEQILCFWLNLDYLISEFRQEPYLLHFFTQWSAKN
jgi:hypothetical protein